MKLDTFQWKRLLVLALVVGGVLVLVNHRAWAPASLAWNATASVPRGLYCLEHIRAGSDWPVGQPATASAGPSATAVAERAWRSDTELSADLTLALMASTSAPATTGRSSRRPRAGHRPGAREGARPPHRRPGRQEVRPPHRPEGRPVARAAAALVRRRVAPSPGAEGELAYHWPVSSTSWPLLYVSLPEPVATFTVARGYRSHHGWFFKRLAGGPGATVCRGAWGWSVDGAWLGNVQVADSRGRALPAWRGCFVVPAGHVVVVGDHPRSFDSRYFGAIAFHHVLAQAEALWTY